jgi:hypothetical protein
MKLGKGKLGKLSMPKRDEVDMSELELEVEPSDSEMAAEDGKESADMSEEAAPSGDALADVADEDLIAELKKRGLMGQLAEEAPAEKARDKAAGAMEEEDEYSEYA